MPFCPKCRDEFQEQVKECPACQVALVEKLPREGPLPEHQFIQVHSTSNHGEIAVIKSLLDEQNIPYYIKGENFAMLYGAADGLTRMDIMVREDSAQEVRELLNDFINPPGLN